MPLRRRIDWELDKRNLFFDCYDIIYNDDTNLVIEKKHRGRIEQLNDESYLGIRYFKDTAKSKSFSDINNAISYLERVTRRF